MPRIEIEIVRWAIQINHIARMGRLQNRDAQLLQHVVEQRQMPVGIGFNLRDWIELLRDGVGNMGAHMGHRNQERQTPLGKMKNGGHDGGFL